MLKLTLSEGHGTGVFTSDAILCGEKIIQFRGPLIDISEIMNESLIDPEDDRYIQIGPSTLMGPSGEMDDYINHSCEPNSGVKKLDGDWWLIAIRDIASKEEIAWDYSTTMCNDTWEMVCRCGADSCRKIIKEYVFLPQVIKNRYEALGVVPDYNCK
jgi:hypothetical protein